MSDIPPMATGVPSAAKSAGFEALPDSPTSSDGATFSANAEQLREFVARKQLEDQARAAAEQARQAETAQDAEDEVDLLAHARAAQGQGQAQRNVRYMAPKSITDCAAFYVGLVYKAFTSLNIAHGLAAVCMFVIWWIVTKIAAALPHWLLAYSTAWLIGNTMFRFLFRAINEA